jgi:hypothetical protein
MMRMMRGMCCFVAHFVNLVVAGVNPVSSCEV